MGTALPPRAFQQCINETDCVSSLCISTTRFHHLAARRDAIMSHRNKLRMRGQARVMFDVEDKVGLAQLYLRYREYPYPGLDVEKEKEKERVAALAASGSPPASSAGGAGAS